MFRTPLKVAAAGTLFALGAGAIAQTADDPALVAQLKARFENDRTGACVVAAVIEGAQVRRARFCANPKAQRILTDDTVFEIGSVTKTMTAFLVADLIESGAWTLDDPIARHLPAGTVLPRQGERQITVRDLVTHTSGLPALPARMRPADPANPYGTLSEQTLLASLADVTLSRPIGSQAEYSNFGMMVLSLAVARAQGNDFEAALKRKLFDPLGMRSAHVVRAPAGVILAQGHTPAAQATPAWTITPNLAGVGMVRASLNDMIRYAQAQSGAVETPLLKTMQRTQQPLTQGFGMNWLVQAAQGRTLISHEGGTGGFSSLVSLEPAAKRAVVVLADTSLADLGGLSDVAAPLLGLNRPLGKPRVQQPIPESLRTAMQGDWELGGLPMRIRSDSGKLMAQAQGQSAFELFYDSRGDFYPIVTSATLTPVLQDGKVNTFRWVQGGGVVEGVRKGSREAPSATNPAWKDWAGEYQLAPSFSLRVFEEGGVLKIQGTGQPSIPAEVTGTDRIEVKAVGAVVEFSRNAQGAVVSATLRQAGQVIPGQKKR
jgi:D-alanyl-D-alanine-carboxypeptidase/D-alanyl-D-alanine-endopeptidase